MKTIGVMKGDTRSLDYGSFGFACSPLPGPGQQLQKEDVPKGQRRFENGLAALNPKTSSPKASGFGFGVWSLGLRVWEFSCRVWGKRFWLWGSEGFGLWDVRCLWSWLKRLGIGV